MSHLARIRTSTVVYDPQIVVCGRRGHNATGRLAGCRSLIEKVMLAACYCAPAARSVLRVCLKGSCASGLIDLHLGGKDKRYEGRGS